MNKTLFTVSAVALGAGVLFFSASDVLAYRGDPNVQGPNYTAERHEAMEKAFAEKNYDAWKNLMQGRGRVTQIINRENFAEFVRAHELAGQGKPEEAAKIREELGLGLQNGSGMGRGMGYGRTNR